MSSNELVDVKLVKLTPTWGNMKSGEDRIAKRLDCFLISENFLDGPLHIPRWVGSGGESNHSPMFMEVVGSSLKHPSPFKFNSEWLKEESFLHLVKDNWSSFDQNYDIPIIVQFSRNLKKVKRAIVEWAHLKHQRDEHELLDIEIALQDLYELDGWGLVTPNSREALKFLEKKSRNLLEEGEAA